MPLSDSFRGQKLSFLKLSKQIGFRIVNIIERMVNKVTLRIPEVEIIALRCSFWRDICCFYREK